MRCSCGVDFGARNRHEPAQTNARQFQQLRREFCQSGRRDTRLLRLVVDVDLDQYVERVGIDGALIRQALRDFGAIEGLHPLKVVGDIARLVRLDRADEMPLQLQVTQRVDFRQRIVQVVLAELGDSTRRCRSNRVGRLRLRCRDHTNRIVQTTASLRGLCDTLLNVGDVVADRVHGGCVNGVAV